MAFRSAVAWIDQSLAHVAEAACPMIDSAEHQAAQDEPRSPSVDLVAAVLERVVAPVA
ncbi:hypothetical protein NKJ13_28780 [Mesorhizobium sp. M0174]|uniref:hypothetical protein n=1 Tax=Mesorhizobium sp. M0174 TaxID=2956904 RepID=UPI00333C8DFA